MPYKNPEDLKRNKQEYYQKNKDKILIARKEYQLLHLEEKSKYDRLNYLENKEEKLKKLKQHYYDNFDVIREGRKELKGRFLRARSVAKRKERLFLLTFEEYVNKVKEPCYYCNDFFPRVEQGIGLDRLDNTVGYVIDNVVSCCKNCNQIKMDILTPVEARAAIAAVIKIRKQGNLTPA